MSDEPALERGRTDEALAVSGVLETRIFGADSRSEHEAIVLRDDEGRCYRLHVVGDHPFEQPTLRGLLGARVDAQGEWRNGVLRVTPGGIQAASDDG